MMAACVICRGSGSHTRMLPAAHTLPVEETSAANWPFLEGTFRRALDALPPCVSVACV